MSVPGSANALLLNTAAAGGYQISRSLRFNSSDSAYLSRTPASAGNRKTWTWAGWVKRSNLKYATLFTGYSNSSNNGHFYYYNDYLIFTWEIAGVYQEPTTAAVFRDPSAWMHVVLATDTTQATDSNRMKMYVNGVQQTLSGSYPPQNSDGFINSTVEHRIGSTPETAVADFDGYLADIYFIDGQALTPTSFGGFDATTGVWNPKAYTGSYGTNGFHLEFADNSSNTATTLGKDTSGNGNNWTPNNLSVTAGAGNDSLVDVPTNGSQTDTGVGGEVRGNYCTWNPLDNQGLTLANGNLDVSWSTNSWYSLKSTIGVGTGKWYYEYTVNSGSSNQIIGLFSTTTAFPAVGGSGYMTASASGWGYQLDGNKSNNNSFTSTGTTAAAGDVIMVAFDMDAAKVWFGKNGTWLNSGNPGTGANAAFSNLSGTLAPAVSLYGSQSGSLNAGARSFAYTAPSGFKALCTANLPAPLVTKPSSHFQVVTDTGANIRSTAEALTFGADLIWIKDRANSSTNHQLLDTTRGGNAIISTSSDAAEGTYSAPSGNSVAWCWNESVTAGFDIVGYAGDNTSNRNISHSLGVAVDMAWIKSRSSGSFYIWHRSLASTTHFLKCNQTDGTASSTNTNSPFGTGNWSSTQFMVTNNATNNLNAASTNYIAYLWSTVVGYSSFGSYTGNGSATDGPFVYTGFRPRYLLIKTTANISGNWYILDTARDTVNVMPLDLYANDPAAESTVTTNQLDILSNGFKLRGTGGGMNGSGHTLIYAAFAESPFNYARAR